MPYEPGQDVLTDCPTCGRPRTFEIDYSDMEGEWAAWCNHCCVGTFKEDEE